MRRIKPQLNYANVMATLAVFLALGGGAYAVTAGKNTVTSKSIRTGAVKSPDVKNNGLKGIDIDESTLSGIQGPPGETGPPGPTDAGVALVGATPVQTPDGPEQLGPATVNATTPGRVLVEFNGTGNVNCTQGSPRFGLYVDGTPVPGTGQLLFDEEPIAVHVAGILPVSAGTRTARVGLDCPDGGFQTGVFSAYAFTAIFLGG